VVVLSNQISTWRRNLQLRIGATRAEIGVIGKPDVYFLNE
jgi:hypothetical protein